MASGGGEVKEPTSAEEWNTLGNERFQRGDTAGAEEAYRRAIEIDPGLFKPYGNLGTVLAGRRKLRDAVALFEKAIELNPKSHRFRTNLGNALRDLGRRNEATEAYRAAIAVQPSHAALHNLAVLTGEAGEAEEAIPLFERALELAPAAYETFLELGLSLEKVGNPTRAAACLGRALEVAKAPEPLDLHEALPGDSADALRIDSLLLAIASRARNATPALAVVERRRKRRDLDGARTLAERLTAAVPTDPRVWILLASLLARDFGDAPGAAEVLLRGNEATGGADEVALSVALAVTAARGEAGRALAEARSILARSDLGTEAAQMALLLAHKCEDVSAADLLDMHRAWGLGIPRQKPVASSSHPRGSRVRVGYLSADFRRHSVARFIEPLLRAHDRNGFEVYCYSAVTRQDPVTQRLQRLDVRWRDVIGLKDREIAQTIANDCVDVLVDLGGHTIDSRLTVLSHRPAPVQISFLGYPGTTGLPDVDFRISDANVEPPGDSDRWSTERILRVPCAWCFQPPEDAPTPHRNAGRPATFGSFNALDKLGPRTLEAWAEILRAVPEARFMLKNAHLESFAARQHLCTFFERAGVDPSRLELVGFVPRDADHLAAYCDVDVALDTFPYHGTTTTCEALWMGVPVVTLAGARHASRVGVSILTNAGLSDLVATDWASYVDKAVRLIRDKERLTGTREWIRERIRGSSLGNPERFTRAIEDIYIRVVGDRLRRFAEQTHRP